MFNPDRQPTTGDSDANHRQINLVRRRTAVRRGRGEGTGLLFGYYCPNYTADPGYVTYPSHAYPYPYCYNYVYPWYGASPYYSRPTAYNDPYVALRPYSNGAGPKAD
jgi:hypothetical protein